VRNPTTAGSWLGVELRHLEAFRAVAEELSFRRAAKRLGFAHSAMSQQIAALEQGVGERLLERSPGGRTVGLTPAGELLLEHADAILSRVAVAERDFALLTRQRQDSVRLGVFQSVGARLLPPALARAAQASATLDVRLVEAERPALLLPRLAAGEIDLAFAEEPPANDRLRHLRLLEDPYVLLVPAGDERAGTERVPLEELARLPLLTYETCFHLLRVEQELARSGLVLRPAFRSDDAPTLHGLVAAGVGYALMPRLALNPEDARVAALAVDERIPARTICLAWHRERTLTPSMKVLLASAKQTAAELS